MTVLWGMRSRFPVSGGFTLLELMISLTIVSMIIVAVYATFNIGTESTRRGTARALDNQHARAALSLLTRQLKSAYPLTLQLAALRAMEEALAEMGQGQRPGRLAGFTELQSVAGFPEYFAAEKDYAGG